MVCGEKTLELPWKSQMMSSCSMAQILAYFDLQVKLVDAGCLAESAKFRPLSGEMILQYDRRSCDFLHGEVCPLVFVDAALNKRVSWNESGAQPIRVAELIEQERLVSQFLCEWKNKRPGPVRTAALIVLRCSSCDRRLIVDGNHRAIWLARHGKGDEVLTITELSGEIWPHEMPDLSKICSCGTSGRN